MHLENKCRQIDASDQRESRVNFLQDRRAQWEDSAIHTAATAAHRLNCDLECRVQEVPQLPVSRYGVGRTGIVPAAWLALALGVTLLPPAVH